MKIALISDTHSYSDQAIDNHLISCDEIWHAGDVGNLDVLIRMEKLRKIRAVYGNIDGPEIRNRIPENQIFELEGKKVWITHIGGYPPKYTPKLKKQLDIIRPDIFICGHSHILKVIQDNERNLLHMNPGAAGQHGFHKMRTLLKFELNQGNISNLNVVELGFRGKIKP